MKKKVIIGCIISFLVIIIIILAIALIISLNSKNNVNNGYYGTGEISAEYQTVANDFINAVKSEKQMTNYINKYFDFRACYAYDELVKKDSIDPDSDLQKLVDYYYNNPDESEIKKVADNYSGGYLEIVNKGYDLTLASIEGPIKYNGNVKFEDIDVTYIDSDGRELTFAFIMYDNKIAIIVLPGDDFEDQEYTINFVDEYGITYKEDYSAFGLTSESMEGILSEDMVDSGETDTGYVIKLKNGINCYYELDSTGCVNYIDFYTNWALKDSTIERKIWVEAFKKYLKRMYSNYNQIEGSLDSLVSDMNSNLSYDDEASFPQKIYDNYITNGHSKYEIGVQGLSETEVELNFIITPISE